MEEGQFIGHCLGLSTVYTRQTHPHLPSVTWPLHKYVKIRFFFFPVLANGDNVAYRYDEANLWDTVLRGALTLSALYFLFNLHQNLYRYLLFGFFLPSPEGPHG